jgi:hypothetical protein
MIQMRKKVLKNRMTSIGTFITHKSNGFSLVKMHPFSMVSGSGCEL